MSKKKDLSALQKRLANRNIDKFARADIVLGIQEEQPRERVIRKSYALIQQDLDRIASINDRCLREGVDISDSHFVRIGLWLVDKMPTQDIIKAAKKIYKIPIGRPRKNR